jgi:hypothetical protein
MNTTNTNITSTIDLLFCEIFDYYFHNTLNLIGMVTNSICIFIFAMILKNERQQSNMFRYFFLKSINDLIYLISQQSSWISKCLDCSLKYLYSINILQTVFYWYIAEVTLLSSGLLDLVATFDCYNLITQKYQFFLTKKSFYILSVTIYAISIIFELFYTVNWEQSPTFFKILHLINLITRDFLILITIVILNMMILYKMKQVTKNRQAIANHSQDVLIINSQNAERNKIKMIVSVGLNFFILHFGNILDQIFYFSYHFKCLELLIFLLFDMTYYNSIIFYLCFNNTFNRIFIEYFTFKRLRLYLFRNRINSITNV